MMDKKVGITLKGVTLDNIAPNIDKNMMEELLNNRELYSDFMRGFNPNIETVVNLTRERDALKYLLQEYKHLEEQERLIKLPCKVGDKLYAISDTRIAECTCCEIKIGIENYVGANFNCDYDCKGCPFNSWEQDFYTGEHSCSGEYGDWYFVLDDFGKTVFLTREEAEAKLKELGE